MSSDWIRVSESPLHGPYAGLNYIKFDVCLGLHFVMKTDLSSLCMHIPGIALRFKNCLHIVPVLNRSDLIYHSGEMQPWAPRAEENQIPGSLVMSQGAVGWYRVQAVLTTIF